MNGILSMVPTHKKVAIAQRWGILFHQFLAVAIDIHIDPTGRRFNLIL